MRRPWIVIRYIREGQLLQAETHFKMTAKLCLALLKLQLPSSRSRLFVLIHINHVWHFQDLLRHFLKVRSTSLNTSLNISLIILEYIKLLRV